MLRGGLRGGCGRGEHLFEEAERGLCGEVGADNLTAVAVPVGAACVRRSDGISELTRGRGGAEGAEGGGGGAGDGAAREGETAGLLAEVLREMLRISQEDYEREREREKWIDDECSLIKRWRDRQIER